MAKSNKLAINDLTKSMNLGPVAGYATGFNWTDCHRPGLVYTIGLQCDSLFWCRVLR